MSADEDDDSDSDDDDTEDDPVLSFRAIPHKGCVNRIRARVLPNPLSNGPPAPPDPYHVATFAETGKVHIFDIAPHLHSLLSPATASSSLSKTPIFTIDSHGRAEGYALDWAKPIGSASTSARLLSGDIHSKIYLTTITNTSFTPSPKPFLSHTDSVEDLQWSPSEPTVFASCSADRSIRVWDTRVKDRKSVIGVAGAHESDVNVISWNLKTNYLLASGGDEGGIKVWDLRNFKGCVFLSSVSALSTLDNAFETTERKRLHQHLLPHFHGILHLSLRSNGTLPKTHVSPPLEPTIKSHYGIFQSKRTRMSDLQDPNQIDSRTFPLNYSFVTKVKRISRKFTGILKYRVLSSRPLRMDSTSLKLCLSPPRLSLFRRSTFPPFLRSSVPNVLSSFTFATLYFFRTCASERMVGKRERAANETRGERSEGIFSTSLIVSWLVCLYSIHWNRSSNFQRIFGFSFLAKRISFRNTNKLRFYLSTSHSPTPDLIKPLSSISNWTRQSKQSSSRPQPAYKPLSTHRRGDFSFIQQPSREGTQDVMYGVPAPNAYPHAHSGHFLPSSLPSTSTPLQTLSNAAIEHANGSQRPRPILPANGGVGNGAGTSAEGMRSMSPKGAGKEEEVNEGGKGKKKAKETRKRGRKRLEEDVDAAAGSSQSFVRSNPVVFAHFWRLWTANDDLDADAKRKLQNRAAQRAFRERKERHVIDLEEKVVQQDAELAQYKELIDSYVSLDFQATQ